MDCGQILETLDAYAIGATLDDETSSIETHVASCVGCWSELEKARETASLISLTVPMRQAPDRLRERIISTAQRETSPGQGGKRRGFLERLGLGWPAAAGAMGVASVAAIAFGLSMQQQVDDLQAENSTLQASLRAETFDLGQQLAETEARVDEQEVLLAVAADEEATETEIEPALQSMEAGAHYTYSSDARAGVVECYGMQPLPPGKLYQMWVVAEDGTHPVATFLPGDGECLVAVDFAGLQSPATAIGVTVESIPGALDEPDGAWVLYSEFPD
jgi:hypothetical protein